jgi:hypothetical protein
VNPAICRQFASATEGDDAALYAAGWWLGLNFEENFVAVQNTA